MSNLEILESQLRQTYAQVVWTHKIQEKQADIHKKNQDRLEVVRILTSALTTSGVIAILLVDGYWLKLATAIVSLVSIFINSYFKVYDLASLCKQHKSSAISLLTVREKISCVLCDMKMGKMTEEEVMEFRNDILEKLEDIYRNCLDASEMAVEQASSLLKNRQDNTFSDTEIDSYLPIYARKKVN